ncbi:MAG: patatin-like phospholipase family protein [Bacillota bacterium]
MRQRPKVGLALGGGAAKGFAHLGVLKVLTDEGIPIDLIAGSSIGSFFGALYALDMDLDFLKKFLIQLPQNQLLDFTVPRMGLIKGDRLEELLRILTKNKDFTQLRIPVYVVAVDIKRGEKVVIHEGLLADAIRGSIAVPGMIAPKSWQDRLLVDGAVLERIPVGVAREKGADFVIGVDVKFGGERVKELKITSIFDVFINSIELMEREIAKAYLTGADILIQPDLSHISSTDFSQLEECINIGMEAAKKSVYSIKEALKQNKINLKDIPN